MAGTTTDYVALGTTTPAASGDVRLPEQGTVKARLSGGADQTLLTVDSGDHTILSAVSGGTIILRVGTGSNIKITTNYIDFNTRSLKYFGLTTKAHGNMGSTETIDFADGNFHTGTLDANCTLTFPSSLQPDRLNTFELWLTQDATGGRSVTWPASVKWANGNAGVGVPAQGANELTRYVFSSPDTGTTWYGNLVGSRYA